MYIKHSSVVIKIFIAVTLSILILTCCIFCEENVKEMKIKNIEILGEEIVEEDEIRLYILSSPGDVLNLDKLAGDVKRLYQTGYFKTVDYEIGKPDEKGYVNVLIKVKEIWDKTITAVEIEGNENIESLILLSNIETKIGETLSKEKIRKSIDIIYSTGYFGNVKSDLIPYNGGTKIKFVVLENPKIKEIELKGNSVLKSETLINAMRTKKNNVLNFFTLGEDRKFIEDFYLKSGYLARIYDLDMTGDGVLKIYIAETIVEDIRIEGEGEEEIISEDGKKEKIKVPKKLKTKDYVIKREIKYTKVGQLLDMNKLKKDLQRIYNLGYFDDISWSPEPGTKEDSVVVVIRVKEGPPRGQAIFGASYGSGGKLTGQVSVSKDNLFGKGRKASISSEFGYITSYSLSYFEPWADKKNTSLGIEVFDTTIKREQRTTLGDIATYDEKKKGGNIVIGRPIRDFTRLSVGFETKKVDIVQKSGTINPQYVTEGSVRSLTLSCVKDTRDNIFNATSGLRDALSVESSGGVLGGNVNFTKYEIDIRRYRRIKKSKFVFAQRLQGGIYKGEKLLTEEFAVGGVDTVRGYDESIYSGTKMIVSNSEIRFPIAGNLTGCFFYDIGNAWYTSTNLSDFKRGTGMGIRFLIPGIGPIRLDYGYNLQKNEGQIHFSFGQMF